MPYRRLPKSDPARLKALKVLLDNNDIYTARNRFIDWKYINEAQPLYDRLLTATQQHRVTLATQTRHAPKCLQLQHKAAMYVSHFLQVLTSHGQHTASTAAWIVDRECFAWYEQVLFLTTHCKTYQELYNLSWCIVLTGLGIGGLLRTAYNDFEDCSHHSIAHLVWVKVSLLHKLLDDSK